MSIYAYLLFLILASTGFLVLCGAAVALGVARLRYHYTPTRVVRLALVSTIVMSASYLVAQILR